MGGVVPEKMAAALPARSAISAVMGYWLTLPRMPSVPKSLPINKILRILFCAADAAILWFYSDEVASNKIAKRVYWDVHWFSILYTRNCTNPGMSLKCVSYENILYPY